MQKATMGTEPCAALEMMGVTESRSERGCICIEDLQHLEGTDGNRTKSSSRNNGVTECGNERHCICTEDLHYKEGKDGNRSVVLEMMESLKVELTEITSVQRTEHEHYDRISKTNNLSVFVMQKYDRIIHLVSNIMPNTYP
jgi:hypothetical protein